MIALLLPVPAVAVVLGIVEVDVDELGVGLDEPEELEALLLAADVAVVAVVPVDADDAPAPDVATDAFVFAAVDVLLVREPTAMHAVSPIADIPVTKPLRRRARRAGCRRFFRG